MSITTVPARPVVADAPPPAPVAPRRGRRDTLAMVLVIAVVLAAMQIASVFVPAYVMPPLSATFGAVVHVLTSDWTSIVVTVVRVLAALSCAAVAGTALGCLMGMSSKVRPYLQSSLVVDTGIPALSWMLIAVFWFKQPEQRIFFVLFVILLPFYALNVHDGIKALPRDWIEAVDVFRPTRWQVFRLLVLPHIVPYILMTTKSIIGYATRMVVFAELIGAAVGIGAKMGLAEATFKMPEVLAWTLILVVINIASQSGVSRLERKLLHWRPEVAIR